MHHWSGRLIMWVLVGSLLLGGHATRSEAGEPLDKIRQTVDDVMDILAQKTGNAPQRHTQIRQAVLKRFGFEEMAQRSLAQHWRTLTPQQRQEFVALFTDLLERSYINRIESYKGGRQGVRYTKENISGDTATVDTEIRSERGEPAAAVEYRLLHQDNDWKVYDIIIEGVSLVNNYRTQFNSIILKDSYAGLVKQMRLKLEQENAASPQKG